jgi:hypothetical protein
MDAPLQDHGTSGHRAADHIAHTPFTPPPHRATAQPHRQNNGIDKRDMIQYYKLDYSITLL